MNTSYSTWLGQAVVLQVNAGTTRIPLRGTIVSESADAVRIRVGEGWDVDIYKAMIVSVEDDWASVIT